MRQIRRLLGGGTSERSSGSSIISSTERLFGLFAVRNCISVDESYVLCAVTLYKHFNSSVFLFKWRVGPCFALSFQMYLSFLSIPWHSSIA